jgi:hypothetical protein
MFPSLEHGTLPKDLPEEPPACIWNIFDPQTGALTLDGHFRDPGERVGVSMDGKSWPHGFHGDAYPHGTVFFASCGCSQKRLD